MTELKEFKKMAKIIGYYYYGRIPKTVKLSEHGGYVFRLQFDRKGTDSEGTLDKVIKFGKPLRKDLALREQKVFYSLSSMGFEVPRPEYTQENKSFGDLAYFIVPWIPGRCLEDIYRDDPERAEQVIKRVGSFIKRLSEVPAESVDGAFGTEEGRMKEIGNWATTWNMFEQNKEWLDPVAFDLLLAAKAIIDKGYPSLVHRDGPQVITDGDRNFAVVDWENAGAGHPMRSLGIKTGEYLIWLKEPVREQDWRSWLMEGYFGNNPVSDEEKKELRLLTIYYMLLITRSNLRIGNHEEAQRIIGLIKEEAQRVI